MAEPKTHSFSSPHSSTASVQNLLSQSSALFLPAVLAPTYNNSATLLNVLNRIISQHLPLIIVNDGSTDSTASLLASWLSANPLENIKVISHKINLGKAAALKTGFLAAQRLGYTHAATIDTDGQLDPEQLPRLIDAARQSPNALILGYRDEKAADYPEKNLFGRTISNMAVRLECGLKIRDSQCGFRVYPLHLVLTVPCRSGRFGYETEIITRSCWAGWSIRESPVTCHYIQPGWQRVTHFKMVRDPLRHIALHLRLLTLALLPRRHASCAPDPSDSYTAPKSWWLKLVDWFNPKILFDAVRDHPQERTMVAIAVAVGVFIANIPAYGFQTFLALYFSRKWHLNPLAATFGSHFSTPPMGPALIAADIWIGRLLLTGHVPSLRDFYNSQTSVIHLVGRTVLDCLLGSFILGTITAVASFFVMMLAFRLIPLKTPNKEDYNGT